MPVLKTDAQFEEPSGILEAKDLSELKQRVHSYLSDYSFRHNKMKKDYESTNLEQSIRQISETVILSSGGGGSGTAPEMRRLKNKALVSGDNTHSWDTPFNDADYVPIALVYWEDPVGQFNPVTSWYLKSFDRYGITIHSDDPSTLSLQCIAIHL